jgi:23S rRNA pseudouridine1911/1915/1917 synthase
MLRSIPEIDIFSQMTCQHVYDRQLCLLRTGKTMSIDSNHQSILLQAKLPDHVYGKRLDQALAEVFPDYSRSRIKDWILRGKVQLNQQIINRPREKMLGGESVFIDAAIPIEQSHQAQAIDLHIVYEDEALLVIDKPANLVVHPGAGNREGTLLNALLNYFPDIAALPRAGIVHRLDKDTTGLMVIAKTVPAHTHLVQQMQSRTISREYEAIVKGGLVAGGKIEQPIGRHPRKRTSMAINEKGKPAITHYRIIEKFRDHTHLRLKLETGRTHQIRVHMAYLRHPLVGDPLYGGRPTIPQAATNRMIDCLRNFKRQALHAAQLSLSHPKSDEWLTWQSPLPNDFSELLSILRTDTCEHGSTT